MSPQAPPRLRTICVKEIEMATIEVKKVEEQLNNRLLFSVHVNADEGHIEIPIGVRGSGIAGCERSRGGRLNPCLRGSARGGRPTSAWIAGRDRKV